MPPYCNWSSLLPMPSRPVARLSNSSIRAGGTDTGCIDMMRRAATCTRFSWRLTTITATFMPANALQKYFRDSNVQPARLMERTQCDVQVQHNANHFWHSPIGSSTHHCCYAVVQPGGLFRADDRLG